MKVVLSFDRAPEFIAGLVREGVRFNAYEHQGQIVVEFTGGF